CFATKEVSQWRFGSWVGASVPLTPSWERISSTHFQQDFLPVGHAHDWMFAQGSPYHFFGTTWGGCGIGGGSFVSELCQMYEHIPEFRIFIAEKLRDGSLTKTNVIAHVGATDWKAVAITEGCRCLGGAILCRSGSKPSRLTNCLDGICIAHGHRAYADKLQG